MVDLPELPFIDTVMTTIVFYGFDDKLPAREVKTLIESICGLLNEMPSHAQVGQGESKRSRSPRFGMLDKAIAKGEFDNYTFFEGVSYFQKGNVRDCSLAVGISGTPGRLIFEVHFKKDREKPHRIEHQVADRCRKMRFVHRHRAEPSRQKPLLRRSFACTLPA